MMITHLNLTKYEYMLAVGTPTVTVHYTRHTFYSINRMFYLILLHTVNILLILYNLIRFNNNDCKFL